MTYMERIVELYPQLKGREEEFAHEFCPNVRFNMTKRQNDKVDDCCYATGQGCVDCWDLPYDGEQLLFNKVDDIEKFIEYTMEEDK